MDQGRYEVLVVVPKILKNKWKYRQKKFVTLSLFWQLREEGREGKGGGVSESIKNKLKNPKLKLNVIFKQNSAIVE